MRYIEKCEKRLDGRLSFTPEEVADGKLTRFVNCLLENNCELHIWTDGYAIIVEYLDELSSADGNHFQVVDEKEVVVDGKYVNWEYYDADGKNE